MEFLQPQREKVQEFLQLHPVCCAFLTCSPGRRAIRWPDAMKRLLLVDDNDKYARLLTAHFEPLGYEIERAYTAEEGWRIYQERDPEHFAVLVTDITMESQLAGVGMIRKIKRAGFPGTIVVANTGFDVPGGMAFSRLFFTPYGVHYLVPKTTVLKEAPLFYPIRFFSEPNRNFVEVQAN